MCLLSDEHFVADDFAKKFVSLSEPASWQWLDTGKAGNDQDFWLSVELAFAEDDNLFYKRLQFHDDDIFTACNNIDPSKVVAHDWKELHQIWKSVSADYKATTNKFTMLGTHTDDFYSFCNGKLATYYLCLQLQN